MGEYNLILIVRLILKYFNYDEIKAAEWLITENEAFSGKSPLESCDTESNIKIVLEYLKERP